MHRFHLPTDQFVVGKKIILPQTEITHIQKSLRLQVGDQIELFNGTGQLTVARLELVSSKEVLVSILSVQEVELLSPQLHLYVGTLKNLNLDELILQKATELGVAKVSFIASEFTQQQWLNQLSFKQDRLTKIAVEACKQSEKLLVPQIEIGEKLSNILKASKHVDQLNLMATLPRQAEQGVELLPSVLERFLAAEAQTQLKQINLFVGPEGGFSLNEHQQALQAGFELFTLGEDLVLRTETAVIACLGTLQALIGSLRQS